MCRAVTCKQCAKTTWAGCGNHVDQVRASVPAKQWCGHPNGGASDANRGGWLSRLLGRR